MAKKDPYAFMLDAHAFVTDASPPLYELFGLKFQKDRRFRFDPFVARESGVVFLQTVLNAYRGAKVKRALISIIPKRGVKKYAYISLSPAEVDSLGLVTALKGRFELKT